MRTLCGLLFLGVPLLVLALLVVEAFGWVMATVFIGTSVAASSSIAFGAYLLGMK